MPLTTHSGSPQGFNTTSSADRAWWMLLDIDGDGDPDLVQTVDTATDADVWDLSGAPYWRVFVAEQGAAALTSSS